MLICVVVVFVLTTSLRPFANLETREGTGAEACPAVVSGIVTRDAKVSCRPFCFPLFLVLVPEDFATVNSTQFPSCSIYVFHPQTLILNL